MQAIGAVGRMAAPQLFNRLWLRAAAQKGQVRALPLGSPMLAVSAIALLQACGWKIMCSEHSQSLNLFDWLECVWIESLFMLLGQMLDPFARRKKTYLKIETEEILYRCSLAFR